MGMSDVMRARRHALGMSQAQLADAVGVTTRQIARYESGEQQPVLSVAAAIARSLDVSLSELAGELTAEADLTGTWFMGWETPAPDEGHPPGVAVHEVKASQRGKTVRITADRTRPANVGGRNWLGELRLWDNEALIGWYRATDGTRGDKGTLYLALDDEASQGHGRWVGQDRSGAVAGGWVTLARTAHVATELLHQLAVDKPAAASQG